MQSLIPIGIVFLGIYVLYALLRTLFSRPRPPISRLDLLLIFIVVLAPFTALVAGGMDGEPDGLIGGAALALAGGLFVSGLVIMLIEALRPPRLRGSRGILMLGAALLLGMSSFAVPFMSVYIALPAAVASDVAMFNTPVNVTGQPTPRATESVGTLDPTQVALATQEYFRPILEDLFNDIYAIVGQETGLELDAILVALDEGESIAQLVEANQGDLDGVIKDITVRVRETVVALTQQGIIPRGQAALFLSQLEFGVRLSVENDVRTLLNRFGGGDAGATGEQRVEGDASNDSTATEVASAGTAEPTSGSLFAFLTVTTTPKGNGAELVSQSPTTTPPPTVTQSPTVTASPSRTPRPTATPTNTRALFVRPTATSTPTLPSPCVALMNFNVNMRREPNLEAELVLTIPYETAVTLFGRDEDAEWWFAEYEGEGGWISDEFITATSSCDKLPVRR